MKCPFVCLLFGLMITEGWGMNFRCPPRDAISPCLCIPNPMYFLGVRIFCYDIRDPGVMEDVVKNLRDLKVDSLELHLSMPHVPTGIWKGVWIRKIAIVDSKMDSLTPDGKNPFAELGQSMNELSLVRTSFSRGLDFAPLRSGLKILTANKVHLPRLSSTVAQVGSLIRLTVADCGIEDMDDDVFSTLTELDEIHLNDNLLQTIARSMFPRPASRLHTIDLSNNKIQSLPKDVFSDLPHLAFLYLDGNEMTTLPEPLQLVWNQLITVHLAGNPFECNCKLMEIFSVLNASKPGDNDMDKMICAGPVSLTGHPLITLTREDAMC